MANRGGRAARRVTEEVSEPVEVSVQAEDEAVEPAEEQAPEDSTESVPEQDQEPEATPEEVSEQGDQFRAIKRYKYETDAGDLRRLNPGDIRALTVFEAARGLELGRIERV